MRNEGMEGSLFKRDQLPKKRATPNNKTLRSAQGWIDRSKLNSTDFSEQDGSYTMGTAGSYFFGESSVEHFMTPVITEFAEDTLVDDSAQLFGGRRLSMEQKCLWSLIGHQASGLNTPKDKRKIQNFILNNKRAAKVAHELLNLRKKQTPLTSQERIKKMKLEHQAGMIATAFTKELRAS